MLKHRDPDLTLPERIRAWTEWQFNPRLVDRVTDKLIDVAAGNVVGNNFERGAVAQIVRIHEEVR